MAVLSCSRCNKKSPGLSESPLPGKLGERVLEQACAACWQDWVSQQLMLMNEYRLDPLNDGHNKFLDEEMVKFLSLK